MSAVLDFPVKPEARDYLARFARDEREPGWLAARRQQAMTRFAEVGFPSRKNERWRYLDLQPLERHPLLPAVPMPPLSGIPTSLHDLRLPGGPTCLVLIDGRFAPGFSSLGDGLPEGVRLRPISAAIGDCADLVASTFDDIDSDRPFAALNGALFSDGFVLDVEPGVRIGHTIEIVHVASGRTESSLHTRSVINLGAGSHAEIVESYGGSGRYWRNDNVTIRIGESALLRRAVLVEESADAIHLGQVEMELGRAAHFTGFALLLGGRRVRHEIDMRLAGEGARCDIDGGFLVTGNDEANIVTTIDHAAGGGQTRELVKGVAADRGHGAFQGCIIVREQAQKTDAQQLSRSLIIGRRAVIDTKPELEIYADDVKCSHGASVGDLDETALFYLKSRGIPAAEARRMLIEGFLREAVEQVGDLAVREHLSRRLAARLGNLEA